MKSTVTLSLKEYEKMQNKLKRIKELEAKEEKMNLIIGCIRETSEAEISREMFEKSLKHHKTISMNPIFSSDAPFILVNVETLKDAGIISCLDFPARTTKQVQHHLFGGGF